ncbi:hypothetical protein GTW66_29975 [Streptomyces sp. SID5473]|uniref:Uncharacterized protein n=1 Tax=Streptomyces tsukubensis (strain DSM 42081 / NBRC 108919 / NRRL 18488 / 9993) TaxID=1114943 RepID=A0A7G3U6H9_STRT9|nr:hypothetical protein [Streptomyces sp. SID5473]QKM65987.1 hypothetical protein STSU_001235 [Streptomyces tsukubensis NRRL18488]TAI42271.1 hypothetical protein EWI31_21975 [Streptomyces tsukubensis]
MNNNGGRGGSSVPDEEWERFLRESVDGTPDAPREPSARARVVARRLRESPGQPEAWRSYTPARPRRKKVWYAVFAGVLVVLALLAVAVAPDRVTGWFGGGDGGADAPLAAESERPTAAPPRDTALRPTPEDPFRGSPAARWAKGTAGITLPPARATGWMNTAQVEQALDRTRDFLAASSLDPAVLRGEHPGRAIALINPRQRDVQDFLSTAFRSPDEKNDPLMLFSRYDDKRVRPVGNDIRTRGRISFAEAKDGALRVTTDVTYVYPFVPSEGGEEIARTIVRREVVLDWNDPAKVMTEPGTFSLVSYSVDITNGGCGTATGRLSPEFGADRPPGAGNGPDVDPYDRSTLMADRMRNADDKKCGTATRS